MNEYTIIGLHMNSRAAIASRVKAVDASSAAFIAAERWSESKHAPHMADLMIVAVIAGRHEIDPTWSENDVAIPALNLVV
jgi:hypothetical protein